MTSKLLCHHGHSWEIADDLTDVELVCHRCGSVMTLRSADDTRRSQSVAITIDTKNPSHSGTGLKPESESASDVACPADDPAASVFVTLDHEPSPDAHSGGSAAGARPSDVASAASRSAELASGAISTEPFEPPQLPGLEILEELGRGGMGVVYRARDKARGREVALKTLQRMNPLSLQRFKQEFRVLADIAHPNLASLYELLSDGQTWCFSMEILEGVEFLEYVWSGFEKPQATFGENSCTETFANRGRLTAARVQRLQDAMTQLAAGLSALHAAGILHTDIKPSNVLMTTEGRLVLLDFGLAVPLDPKKGGSKLIQGTPRYMSPEQANAEPLTEASDWYAVGVMLYEALTGRLPFRGNTMQILSKKRTESPLEPARYQLDNPTQLNDLCMALLNPDPSQRPAVEEILRCFHAADVAEMMIAPRRAAAAKSIELVGRERHVARLRASFARVTDGDTLSLFVHGKSGMGKSVLVRSFLDSISASEEAIVLEGRCYEQESVPFKALDSLIDSLAVYLATLPDDVVHGLMPRDRKALTRVFPVLGGVPEAPQARYPTIENADQQELRQRAMNALRELLQRLAIREPLVLYVDDLQWGDVDSAALLADLVRPPDAPQMLLLGSYRTEDAETSSCLRALDEAYQRGQHLPHREELAVESLTEAESAQLAIQLLERDDDTSRTFAKKIAQESHGWPFFVWELVQHVQEDPEIADQGLVLDEVIWARVNRLPKSTIQLLELIAVAGRPLPSAEAYQALDAVAQGPGLLAQLRTNNFIRTTESDAEGTVVETYHDRIREAVVNHLDDQTVQGHNLKLALMIEQASGLRIEDIQAHIDRTADYEDPDLPCELEQGIWQRVFDLAYYFDAAGHPERAFPYALVAAEQTWSQDALEVAEQQFRIAARGAASVAERLRFRVAEGLGDVLTTRGKYDEALRQFETAGALATGDLAPARIDGKLGVLASKRGDMGGAAKYLEAALRKLGDPPPRSALVQTVKLAKEGVIQLLHTYWPSRFLSCRSSDTAQCRKDLFRVRLYDRLTIVYWFTRGMVPTLWSHLRQMNLVERYPPSKELGRTYSFHAITMTGIPNAQRGITYAERAYEISSDLGDLWGQGQARGFQTFSCIVLARLREAMELSREAVRLLEQAGDVWEANMARMIGTMAVYHLGDLQTALRESKRAYEIGKETGDYSAMAIAMWLWVQIHPASVPTMGIKAEFERSREDPLSEALAIQARALELLLREDQPREAAKVLQQSLDLARRRSIRNVCVYSGVTWKATALRVAAERETGDVPRKRALKKAKQAVHDALKITNSYHNCRPQALRERALIAVLEGNEAQARRYFDDSLRVAEVQEARYERAKSLLARAEAGIKFHWPEAEQQRDEARTIMDDAERLAADETSR